ncbi:unnamed protein product [Didymodactylos carnosus]|uniref:Methylated-DNA--protein-cysteine methyltransferase n=1 Tax=Didymodactylos carnosus TaxID=1234261 RepID=A0A813P116_9BILA|nr:unnamed protein product [Didymodactylos carnosus]CAF0751424.1 unnamed protein product [Didymodactylos carnosus]CAF3524816.1 unnamed protein product [Didymodactylos carnosus]CAF3530227.1 unnamed protein product [Didymodactylos carnosus]
MCEKYTCICLSPIGNLKILYCLNGLHSIQQVENINDESFQPNRSQMVTIESNDKNDSVIVDSCISWLQAYFHDPDKLSLIDQPKLCKFIIDENAFQHRVWLKLYENVKYGNTISYGGLAQLVGSPNAARAVGTAMKCNPFQLLVPCHRVIQGNGNTGRYSGGKRNTVKMWLLKHEKTNI